ncbi:hypothetical protein YC2023_005359 [Brassica napus]
MRIYIKLGYLTKLFCIDSKEPIITKKSFVLVEGPPQYIYIYCKRRAKKAESDAATMEPTTGKATVAEEAPGAGAGDSMVAAVAELTSTTETKRATKKFFVFFFMRWHEGEGGEGIYIINKMCKENRIEFQDIQAMPKNSLHSLLLSSMPQQRNQCNLPTTITPRGSAKPEGVANLNACHLLKKQSSLAENSDGTTTTISEYALMILKASTKIIHTVLPGP